MAKVIDMFEWLNKKRLEGKYKGTKPISVKEKIRLALLKWGSHNGSEIKKKNDKDIG